MADDDHTSRRARPVSGSRNPNALREFRHVHTLGAMTRIDPTPAAPDPFHPPGRPTWLALGAEPVLEPGRPIVDAHHHLFDRPHWRYRDEDLRRDVDAGHRVVATVYLQCGEAYRADGPAHLRPVGETEFVESVARRSAQAGGVRMCAAIVGFADLTRGAAVEEVLHAHLAASPARFRGIRHGAATDDDPAFVRQGARPRPALLGSTEFREGFARLAPLGLSFDAWMYHPQLPGLVDLARAFPDTTIVLNHAGGPAGIGGYAGRRDEVFAQWHASIRALAACPNVVAKLGGLGMRFCGFGFERREHPPDSAVLADAWRPYVSACIDAFGPARCMFESNFPVDQCSCSYVALWNAFKRIAAGCGEDEKASLFAGTAARVYRLDVPGASSV